MGVGVGLVPIAAVCVGAGDLDGVGTILVRVGVGVGVLVTNGVFDGVTDGDGEIVGVGNISNHPIFRVSSDVFLNNCPTSFTDDLPIIANTDFSGLPCAGISDAIYFYFSPEPRRR